ncbi:bile acid:sodium symporter family protein [Acinetobacter lanii]|uniref:Bile acid:sodium symporter family protein n=1 Tax=Acinetobacter lanii TaxID=2715163 RepID=A0A6G8S557_9GAMM|nr:bile acid:sodium symporter family protein [Acinetobacter lanii]QIO09366.1 bile acid:sodium symporter family protein [Acinetobacter lanii]
MDQLTLITILLPAALGIIMIGLGLELTLADFKRVKQRPKAVLVALFCQFVLLTLVAFGLSELLHLPPELAVGLVLLSASPGGPVANLYSYLYKGDVALNITLTAINAIIAAVALPIIVNLALAHFIHDDQKIGLQFSKVIQVFSIIIVPVIIGMTLRHYQPHLAHRLNKPVKIFAIGFLILIMVGAISQEGKKMLDYAAQVGVATALFCIASLNIGYFVPRLFNIEEAQARACAFEIGIHNGTLAMTIAITVLGSTAIAIPAAIYGIVMLFFTWIFGSIISRKDVKAEDNPAHLSLNRDVIELGVK